MISAVDRSVGAHEPDLWAGPPKSFICVVEPGLNIRAVAVPNCHSPLSRPGWGARGGRRVCGECAGCLWARERYAMSALRCFITSKAKLKKIKAQRPAPAAPDVDQMSTRFDRFDGSLDGPMGDGRPSQTPPPGLEPASTRSNQALRTALQARACKIDHQCASPPHVVPFYFAACVTHRQSPCLSCYRHHPPTNLDDEPWQGSLRQLHSSTPQHNILSNVNLSLSALPLRAQLPH